MQRAWVPGGQAHATEGNSDLGMRSGWRCRICRCMSSTKAKLDEKKCKGAVANKWEELAATAAAVAEKDTDGHTRVYSGEVVWCSTCGVYADKKRMACTTFAKELQKGRTRLDSTNTVACWVSCAGL